MNTDQATGVQVWELGRNSLQSNPGVYLVVHLEIRGLEAFLKEIDSGLKGSHQGEVLTTNGNKLVVQLDEGVDSTTFKVLDEEVEGLL